MHLSPIRLARALQALAALLVFAAGLLLSPASASAATHHVTISSYSYHPSTLTVTAGDSVTWTNLDSVAHDVTVTRGPALFHSPLLSQGQSWTYTFTVAGPYTYICSVHPDMTASVTVQPVPVQAPVVAPTHHPSPAPRTSPQRVHAPTASAPTAIAPSVAATPLTATSATPTTQVNPLLVVGGALCAVLIFCLLVMASRPYRDAPDPATTADQDDIPATPHPSPPPPPSAPTAELVAVPAESAAPLE